MKWFPSSLAPVAFAAGADVERAMSFHRADSDLSRLNTAPAGALLAVDAGLVDVLRLAPDLHAGHPDGRAPSAFVHAATRERVADPRTFSVLADTCAAADALTKVLTIAGRLPAGASRWNAQPLIL